jgi:tetratricopeptide (TPR) repeat protein
MKLRVWVMSWLMFLGWALTAQAAGFSGSLPSYCVNQDEKSRMQVMAGFPVHHYCYGLKHLNNYYAATKADGKKYQLSQAASEFRYVISHSSANSAPTMLSEVYMTQARVHTLQNHKSKALMDYFKAIELNPKQSRAYTEIAMYYESLNMKDRALDIVTKGLQYIPGDTVLQSKYQKLGGKMPFPEPVAEAQPEAPPAPAPETLAEKSAGEANSEPGEVSSVTKAPPSPATSEGGSGTSDNKDNPWCRFCP